MAGSKNDDQWLLNTTALALLKAKANEHWLGPERTQEKINRVMTTYLQQTAASPTNENCFEPAVKLIGGMTNIAVTLLSWRHAETGVTPVMTLEQIQQGYETLRG